MSPQRLVRPLWTQGNVGNVLPLPGQVGRRAPLPSRERVQESLRLRSRSQAFPPHHLKYPLGAGEEEVEPAHECLGQEHWDGGGWTARQLSDPNPSSDGCPSQSEQDAYRHRRYPPSSEPFAHDPNVCWVAAEEQQR